MTTGTQPRAATPAAGGVVWRLDGPHLLVAVVHRPRYQDWTLPKGKAELGEPLLLTALREVGEETGARVEAGRRLSVVEYPIADGTVKRVSHWAMRYLSGEPVHTDEVDEVRWLTVAEATQLLTYPIDRYVLADFARVPAGTRTILLIRHAKAGKRADYRGDDRTRPLDKIGRRHARDAAPVLAAFAPQRVVSADLLRCLQTVQPLADLLGLAVQPAPEFSDESYQRDRAATRQALYQLAEQPGASAICSQGEAIPGLLADLNAPAMPYPARKGSLWVLSLLDRRVASADYYPHPAG
ncbi:MAG TPA: bifunctional NUDIX hydrolase/histidine phosphatase family protein [Jatrophihabitans sp.]|nr:bifunctional NUDIX hydrolase/histidine phosphatase family protein [Jatrophihabitans sp.]